MKKDKAFKQNAKNSSSGGIGREAILYAAGAAAVGVVLVALSKMSGDRLPAWLGGGSPDDDGTGQDGRQRAAFDGGESVGHSETAPVRTAGPDAMRDSPTDWDAVDQAADESFPASDPPATY